MTTEVHPAAPVETAAGRLASPAVIRLGFYVGYYALHVAFVSEWFTILITLPIFLICCFNVARIEENHATARDMIWLTIYLLLVISTCQTLFDNYFESEGLMEGLRFETDDILKASLIVVVFLLVATVTTECAGRVGSKTVRAYELGGNGFGVILLANLAAFALYIAAVGGFANALADRVSKEDFSQPIATTFLSVQLATCFLGAAHVRSHPLRLSTGASLALMLALLLVSQNPFNTARYYLMIAWMPVLFIGLSGRMRLPTFYLAALLGLVVIMPVLNFTGRFGESVGEALDKVELTKNIFKVPFIDLFDMLAFAVEELKRQDYYFGAKTLSLVFFVIPRAIWPGKEVLLGTELGLRLVDAGLAGTDILSMFIAADFYADLGMIGVAVGAFVMSLLLTVYGLNRTVLFNGLNLPGFVVMASAPILIRGPFGAVIPLPFMVLVVLWISRLALCSRVATYVGAGRRGSRSTEQIEFPMSNET